MDHSKQKLEEALSGKEAVTYAPRVLLGAAGATTIEEAAAITLESKSTS